ncbi:hypothetical protein ABK040_000363 [Willaertia magna]
MPPTSTSHEKFDFFSLVSPQGQIKSICSTNIDDNDYIFVGLNDGRLVIYKLVKLDQFSAIEAEKKVVLHVHERSSIEDIQIDSKNNFIFILNENHDLFIYHYFPKKITQNEFLEKRYEILNKQINSFGVDKNLNNKRLVISYKSGKLKGKATIFSYKNLIENDLDDLQEITNLEIEDPNQLQNVFEILFVDQYLCFLISKTKMKENLYYKRFKANPNNLNNFINISTLNSNSNSLMNFAVVNQIDKYANRLLDGISTGIKTGVSTGVSAVKTGVSTGVSAVKTGVSTVGAIGGAIGGTLGLTNNNKATGANASDDIDNITINNNNANNNAASGNNSGGNNNNNNNTVFSSTNEVDELRNVKYVKNSMIYLEGKIALFRFGPKLWKPCYLDGEKYYVRNLSTKIEDRQKSSSDGSSSSKKNRKKKSNISDSFISGSGSGGIGSGIGKQEDKSQNEDDGSLDDEEEEDEWKEEFKFAYINCDSFEPLCVTCSFPYVACLQSDSLDIYNLYWRETLQNLNNNSLQQNKLTMQARKVYSLPNNKDGTTIFSDDNRFYVVTENANAIRYLSPPTVEIQLKTLREELLSPQAHHLFKLKSHKNKYDLDFRKDLMEFQFANGKANLERGRPKEAFKFFLESLKQNRYLSPEDRKDIREILRYFVYFRGSTLSQFNLIAHNFFNQHLFTIEDLREKLTMNFKQGKIKIYGNLDSSFILKDFEHYFMENYINLIIHKTIMYLMEFLEIVNFKYRPDTLEQQAVIEYTLLALYTLPHPNMYSKEFDEKDRKSLAYYHLTCYENIEKIVKRKHENGFEKYIEPLFKILTDTNCWRHAALLANNLGQSTQQVMNIFKTHIKNDIYYPLYDGVDDIVDILSQMDGNSLLLHPAIREYISWVISLNPSKSVKIFTAKRDNPPSPELVLEFLNPYPLNMTVQYLHYLIVEMKGKGITDKELNKYHTDYALYCIDYINLILPNQLELKLIPKAGQELGELGKYRNYLLQHIINSNRYNKDLVDKKLNDTKLDEEKIALFHSMGKHEEALSVLVKLDLKRAEEYCDQVYKEEQLNLQSSSSTSTSGSGSGSGNNSVMNSGNNAYNPYLIKLIEICTHMKFEDNDEQAMIQRMMSILSLLQRRANDIDILEVINVLPDHMELKHLSNFLTQAIQFTHHNNRTTLIKNELARNASMQIRNRYVKATTRSIIVNSTTTCPVCEQPIGNSVFAVFPDQSVVHYRCLTNSNDDERKEKNKSIHPKNLIDFRKFPQDF